jgi:hypothetical protein
MVCEYASDLAPGEARIATVATPLQISVKLFLKKVL